jgi:hypothetical protein
VDGAQATAAANIRSLRPPWPEKAGGDTKNME